MESLRLMASEKEAEVSRLQAKVASLESRLAETLAGAPDDELVNTREELLQQAWKERDEAVEKQHDLELQLTQVLALRVGLRRDGRGVERSRF